MSIILILAQMRRQQALAASIASMTAAAAVAAAAPRPLTAVPATAAVMKSNENMIQIALTCASSLGVASRSFTSSLRMMSNDLPERSSSYYRVPSTEEMPFAMNRGNVAERKSLGRIEAGIQAVLAADGVLQGQLVAAHGFCIHQIRVSKDKRRLSILWDANPGRAKACQRELDRSAARLRNSLSQLLRLKFTPYLEFTHDHLPARQAEAAAAMEVVEQELHADTMGQPDAAATPSAHKAYYSDDRYGSYDSHDIHDSDDSSQHAAGGGHSGDAQGLPEGSCLSEQDIEAAIARMTTSMQPKPRRQRAKEVQGD